MPKIPSNAQVTIHETVMHGGELWGKTKRPNAKGVLHEGWIKMSYVELHREEATTNKLSKKDVEKWLKKFRKLDTDNFDQCQLFVNSFVNAVYVYDDRLVMTSNARDGTHVVKFDEVE